MKKIIINGVKVPIGNVQFMSSELKTCDTFDFIDASYPFMMWVSNHGIINGRPFGYVMSPSELVAFKENLFTGISITPWNIRIDSLIGPCLTKVEILRRIEQSEGITLWIRPNWMLNSPEVGFA